LGVLCVSSVIASQKWERVTIKKSAHKLGEKKREKASILGGQGKGGKWSFVRQRYAKKKEQSKGPVIMEQKAIAGCHGGTAISARKKKESGRQRPDRYTEKNRGKTSR